jgi:hypothetical protein
LGESEIYWSHTNVSSYIVYYESRKRELKTRLIHECRCDERLKTKTEKSTLITYTGVTRGIGTPKDRDQ